MPYPWKCLRPVEQAFVLPVLVCQPMAGELEADDLQCPLQLRPFYESIIGMPQLCMFSATQ